MTILKEKATAGFHAGPLSWSNCNLEGCFGGGKNTGEPRENPSEQGENQQQNQSTYGTGTESNPGHICGRRALSPLHDPFSPAVIQLHVWNHCACFQSTLYQEWIDRQYLNRK